MEKIDRVPILEFDLLNENMDYHQQTFHARKIFFIQPLIPGPLHLSTAELFTSKIVHVM